MSDIWFKLATHWFPLSFPVIYLLAVHYNKAHVKLASKFTKRALNFCDVIALICITYMITKLGYALAALCITTLVYLIFAASYGQRFKADAAVHKNILVPVFYLLLIDFLATVYTFYYIATNV